MSNLTLADVVQLEGQNRFSGSILVTYQDQEGQIFFQRGEVVHAETGSLGGEAAFNLIMGWPGGSFRLHPNVTSLHQSIHKRLDHLLLSAHQWLDESRVGLTGPVPDPTPTQAGSRTRDLTHVVAQVPGVDHAVFMDRHGAPRGEGTSRSEGLAARGAYLSAMVAGPLSEALGLGELQVAAMHAGPERVLLFKSRETSLAVSLAGDATPESVEAGIRQALTTHRTAK